MFPKVDTNRFDLSHDVKLSFSMGELIPTCVMECLPGDKVEISVNNMLRFAPLVSPVMHRVRVTTDYFFVPNRILWSDWEKWITGDAEVEAPFVTLNGEVAQGTVSDYLGIPPKDYEFDIKVSPLPHAAYLKIYDEFYRDQNLQSEEFLPINAGEQVAGYEALMKTKTPLHRNWEHDYFTSALPFAQKGDEVQIPLTNAPDQVVQYMGSGDSSINAPVFRNRDDDTVMGAGFIGPVENAAGPTPITASMHVDGQPAAYDPNGSLVVDVQSDATSINTLRRAFRLQEWLERNARGGTRYIENILAHFGVRSSDKRLQRPEWIGRDRQNMVISEVLATAQSTDDGVAVGTMAGHGISVGGGKQFSYRCEEHGYIIGLINVQPDTAYQDGLHRSFSRFDRLDYAWPSFAHIGEQEIMLSELYAHHEDAPISVFGYIPRYSEYKFLNSRVAGEMRSSLAYWHLGRQFASSPALNALFVRCDPSTRIFAVTDPEEDHIFAHIYNDVKAVRKLPRFGIPTI